MIEIIGYDADGKKIYKDMGPCAAKANASRGDTNKYRDQNKQLLRSIFERAEIMAEEDLVKRKRKNKEWHSVKHERIDK